MKLITVVPITRSFFHDYLTYFSLENLAPGDLVEVPLKAKSVAALVVKTAPLVEAKSRLRLADFKLKKVTRRRARQFLAPEAIAAATTLATESAMPLGAVLKSVISQSLLVQTEKINLEPSSDLKPETSSNQKVRIEKLVIQDSDNERLVYYKSLVREAFAKRQSVLVLEPSLPELFQAEASLAKGIADYTLVLHGSLTPKALLTVWQRLLTEKHPLLIIATPSFLALPRADLGLIILDHEHSPHYRQSQRPFTDYHRLAELLAAARRIKLLLGDLVLRTETLWRIDEREFWPARPLKQRLPGALDTRLVMIKSSQFWSEEANQLLNAGEPMLIIANRRGLAPLVICDDCGEAVLCDNCESPLVLYENGFRCHQCGQSQAASDHCRRCDGWRLRPLGIGLDRVAKELKTLAPARPVFQFDGERIKTYRQGAALLAKFRQTRDGILLGTEMVLPYLDQPVANTVVVTVEAMLALPDFRISDKVFTLLSRLRAKTQKTMIIQTRQAHHDMLEPAARGQIFDFYRTEIALREKLDYPPFKTFIKISRIDEKTNNRRIFNLLAKDFAAYEPTVYPSFHQPGPAQSQLNLLLKLKPADWPNPQLLEKLKTLPPDFLLMVNPESLL